MSITSKKITPITVLKGGPSTEFLNVKSSEYNKVVDDLTSQDSRIAILETGTDTFPVHITSTTDTTSGTTGALIVDGGVGIAKKLFIADTTDSTNKDTGSIITDGGLGVEKAANIGTTLGVTGITTLTAGAIFGAANTYKGATTITAFATGGQTSATVLTAEENNITVCATAGDSVKLPVPALGMRIYVKNNGATDLAVFGTTGVSINSGAANASITIPVGATKVFNAISTTDWETTTQVLSTAAGSVTRPAITFNDQSNMGAYKVSSTQLGVAVSGVLVAGFDTNGVFTNKITEQTSGSGVTLSKNIIRQNTATALNSTGTITAAMLNKGLITTTSAAAVTGTLDAIATIAAQIGAVQGTSIEFTVDNTAGANTFTVVVSTGIVAATPIITGGATLTVAASATQGIGIFRLVFSSASAAVLFRIG